MTKITDPRGTVGCQKHVKPKRGPFGYKDMKFKGKHLGDKSFQTQGDAWMTSETQGGTLV